jgi:hypothetical protein
VSFGLPARAQLLDDATQLADLVVSELQGLDHLGLRQLARTGFDHDDRAVVS